MLKINPAPFWADMGRKLKMQLKNCQNCIHQLDCLRSQRVSYETSTFCRAQFEYQWARQFIHESDSIVKCRMAFKLFLSIWDCQLEVQIFLAGVHSPRTTNYTESLVRTDEMSPRHRQPTSFNLLNTKRRLLYLKTQFVPRSKHFISVIKTNQFML